MKRTELSWKHIAAENRRLIFNKMSKKCLLLRVMYQQRRMRKKTKLTPAKFSLVINRFFYRSINLPPAVTFLLRPPFYYFVIGISIDKRSVYTSHSIPRFLLHFYIGILLQSVPQRYSDPIVSGLYCNRESKSLLPEQKFFRIFLFLQCFLWNYDPEAAEISLTSAPTRWEGGTIILWVAEFTACTLICELIN